MGKKGDFSFDEDDGLSFDDEMFPIDDDFGDVDFAFGSESGGKKGFFKNVAKSIKGLGVDILNEFLPEAINIADEFKNTSTEAISKMAELKDKISERKAKALENKGSFKSDLKKELGSFAKETKENIKKGKFYKSSSEIDLSDMFGDDDSFDMDDGGSDSYSEREPEDTSGKLVTKMSSSKRNKATKLVFNNDNSGLAESMEKIQENAIATNARIQYKLNTKNMLINEQNYAKQMKVLTNIATNVYSIASFLNREGATSVRASLEYKAKSLAFMVDQTNLLKDIFRNSNKQLGILEEQEKNYDEENTNPFASGFFDASAYRRNIVSNAKNMFMGSMAGQLYEMYNLQKEMSGSMGKKMTFGGMIKDTIKGSIPGLLLSSKTKEKLESLNTLLEGAGGAFIARMNRLSENSNNPILSTVGRLLGLDTYSDKSVDMGLKNPRAAVPFDEQTRKTINTVIPGYLSKITAALTNGEETYFDYKSGVFRTNSSLMEKYSRLKKTSLNYNSNFSNNMNIIYENILKSNDSLGKNKINSSDINEAFEKFKENVANSRIELNKNDLIGNKEYQDKLFKGIIGKNTEQTIELKNMIISAVNDLSKKPGALQMLNSAIFATAAESTRALKEFKEESLLYGGDLALAGKNIDEKFEASDFNLKFSKNYNAALNIAGTKGYFNALKNAADLRESEFNERGGLVSSIMREKGEMATVGERLGKIYDLLLDGIVVFPSSMSKESMDRINGLKKERGIKILKEQKQKEEERLLNEEREKERIRELKEQKLAERSMFLMGRNISENGALSKVQKFLGVDKGMNLLADVIGSGFNTLFGYGGTGNILDYNVLDNDPELKAILDARRAAYEAKMNGASGKLSNAVGWMESNKDTKGIKGWLSRTGLGMYKFGNENYKKAMKTMSENSELFKNIGGNKSSNIKNTVSEYFNKGKSFISSHIPEKFKTGFDNFKSSLSTEFYGRKGIITVLPSVNDTRRAKYKAIIEQEGFAYSESIDPETVAVIGKIGSEERKMINDYKIKTLGANIPYNGLIDFLENDAVKIILAKGQEDIVSSNEDDYSDMKFEKYKGVGLGLGKYDTEGYISSEKPVRSAPLININSSKTDNSVKGGGLFGFRRDRPDKSERPMKSDDKKIRNISSKIFERLGETNEILLEIKKKIRSGKGKKGRGLIGNLLHLAGTAISLPFKVLGKGLKLGGKGLKGILKGGWGLTKGLAKAGWGMTKTAAKGAWGLTKGLATKGWDLTKLAASGAWGLTKKTAKGAKDLVLSGMPKLFKFGKKTISGLFNYDEIQHKLKAIAKKIESGKELTEEEKAYWETHKEELDEKYKEGLIIRGLGFLFKAGTTVFDLAKNGLYKAFLKTKGLVVDGSGKIVDALKNSSSFVLRSIGAVKEKFFKGKPWKKHLRALKKEYKELGESLFNNMTLEEGKARLAEIMNVPVESLDGMTLTEIKAKLREYINQPGLLGKIGGFFGGIKNKIKSFGHGIGSVASGIGRGKIDFGKYILAEARGIRIMLEKQYGPINMSSIYSEIESMSPGKSGGSFLSSMKNTGSKILGGMKDIGSNILGKLKGLGIGALSIIPNLLGLGSRAFGGIKNGLSSLGSKIKLNKEGNIEGSYADKLHDDKVEEQEKREEAIFDLNLKQTELLGIMAASGGQGIDPKELKKLMNEKTDTKKSGFMGAVASGLGKVGAVAGSLGAVAAGVVGAMALKKTYDKVKLGKTELKDTNFGQKISYILGGTTGANYDSHGNEIDESTRSTRAFGLSSLRGSTVAAVGGIAKLGLKLKDFITKILSSPPMSNYVGKAAAGLSKTIFGKIGSKIASAGAKISAKIAGLIGKASNPIGWGVLVAQTAADFISGMNKTSRYFKLGKGIKPTLGMKITSGLTNILSNFLFGLLPTETLVNIIYNFTASNVTKDAMNKGRDFVNKRAKIMGVDGARLTEYETMPLTERIFGGITKPATILGFAKGKSDKNGISRYKEWRDRLYKPLMDLYDEMKKQYGGNKVESVAEDDETIEMQENFRNAYLKEAANYVKKNGLEGLGVNGSLASSYGSDITDNESGESVDKAIENASKANIPSTSTKVDTPQNHQVSSYLSGTGSTMGTASVAAAAQGGSNIINTVKNNNVGFESASNVGTTKKSFFQKVEDFVTGNGGIKGTIINGIKNASGAISNFISGRKSVESELTSAFQGGDDTTVLKLAEKIKDPSALGQQTTTAKLNPEFARRVEAFLKDPRVAGTGVKIRESFRSPLTQLAYFSKGRASSELTDKLMKMAGFKYGINFWPKSFQNPGQYNTWTIASNHFTGQAVDLEPGSLGYNKLGEIAKEYGISWGGYWDSPDPPHFEIDPSWKGTLNSTSGSARPTNENDLYQADASGVGVISPLAGLNTKNFNFPTRAAGTIKKTPFMNLMDRMKGSNTSSGFKIPQSAKSSYVSRLESSTTSGRQIGSILDTKLDELYELSSKGISILENMHTEQLRHNKVNEQMLASIIAAVMALQNGGNSNMNQTTQFLTNEFSGLAKGL